jgi:hypothetical protein
VDSCFYETTISNLIPVKQMDQSTLTAVSLVCIIGAPWLGSASEIASNSMVRLALLGFILYSTQVSELTGLLAMLAAVSVISERNYRMIIGIPSRGHIPMKRDSLFENADVHITPITHSHTKEVDESEYVDGNPRLPPAPTGARSAQFYMDKKLAV